jgi:hypothetical protein
MSAAPLAIARPHPLGGWCVAVLESPGVSSCRVYRGHFSSERAAAQAARRISAGSGCELRAGVAK